MLLFEGILSDSVMVFAMNQAGKSPFSLTLLVPIKEKKKKTSKRTSKERSPISDQQWHQLVLFC